MKPLIAFVLLSLTLGPATALYGVTDAPPPARTGPVPARFVVKLKPDVRIETLVKALGGQASLRPVSSLRVRRDLIGAERWSRYYIFTAPGSNLSPADVARQLGQANIEYVEPDYWLEFFEFPSDSLFPNQWYLYNVGQEYLGIDRIPGNENDHLVVKDGLAGVDINLAPFYQAPPPDSAAVVVAIVDSGIDLVHPELQGRFWRNLDEIPLNGVDDDHNGYVDDTLGYDVSGDSLSLFDPQGDNDPTDTHGHGTHLAGIVAANANRHGIVGIAPWVKLMPVKIRPNGTTSVGAAGIVYAVNAGAQVINISWGTPFQSGILEDAIRIARENGVFVSIAPGNTGDNTRYYPAACDSTFVVAAGDSRGHETEFSTYGAHIDVVAPGLDILSLRATGTDMYAEAGEPGVRIIGPDSLYYLADGTSMAAPMAAGAAALLLSFRPDLSLGELEELLLLGADDMIDPRNQGDTLIGPDTLSGYGYLNVAASLALLQTGGLGFAEPQRRARYTSSFAIKAAPAGGYTGGWLLEYAVGLNVHNYQYLAAGTQIPADSVLFVFDDPSAEGFLNFRLTDKYGSTAFTDCVHVRQRRLEILSPQDNIDGQYSIPIIGNAYGPDYDSLVITSRKIGQPTQHLLTATGEYFDSLLIQWTVSGVDTGDFVVSVIGYYEAVTLRDSVSVHVVSAFADGWPKTVAGFGGITAVCADLHRDGQRELIVPSSHGLYVFDAHGNVRPGFPALPDRDWRSVPAIYDVDRDGRLEIIATNEDGIHVFNDDGSYAAGWPVTCYTGTIPYGYGYPNPTVTRLGMDEDSAIVIINKQGQIMAYQFDGTPYFYSMDGWFATFDPRISNFYSYGGFTSPFVTSYDVTGDGINEVVATYTAPEPHSGLGIFDGRTGQPAFGRESPLVEFINDVQGATLADLNGDRVPEIIVLGRDRDQLPHLWVKTNGLDDLPGWPITLPSAKSWIGSYPIAADLDLDGIPEILCTYFEYDVATLFAFRADGTPYADRGGPPGALYRPPYTLGTPIVANLTGDDYPEIIIRSGHILPGTGPEMVHILDHEGNLLPGWPVPTPAPPGQVFSSRFAPLVDDLDGDGLVELIVISDSRDILVWNFDASWDNGNNHGKFLVDNINSGVLPPSQSTPTDVDGRNTLPGSAWLAQNYPNPFNPTTVIEFSLPRRSNVTLEIFNILGQRVTTLADGSFSPGVHQMTWTAADQASGVYFYRLTADGFEETRKMMLVK